VMCRYLLIVSASVMLWFVCTFSSCIWSMRKWRTSHR